ncbi:MAG: energy transducer TonB [Candidatus Babeliaceae bacterium]|nr:energy transducer TonB [Candidatus Babeliaceae bacterium]
MWNEKNIFEPSGCLSREAFVAFLEGKLTPAAKFAADAHIASCPFCADAIDGFRQSKSTPSVLLEKVDRDFQEKYASSPIKNKVRKIWITGIAAAASILLLVTLFLPQRKDNQTQQIALNEEKKTDTVIPKSKTTAKYGEQIALYSEPATSKSKPSLSRATEPAAKSLQTMDEISIEQEENALPSIEYVAAQPEYKDELKTADTLIALNKADKADSNQGYIAYSEEKQKETAYELSAAKKSVAARRSAEAPAYTSYTPDEEPRFVYSNFTDFSKYIESNLPVIADSSRIGKAYIEVSIDEKGNVSDAKIIRGINAEADKAIIKKVKDSPRWTPGKKNGQAVSSKTYWTIRYQL